MATKKVITKGLARSLPKADESATPLAKVVKNYVRTFSIDGVDYTLDFHLRSLAEGENACIRQGHFISLMYALNPATMNLNRLRNLFACAIHKHHPELTYEAATELLQPENVIDLANMVFEIFALKAAA